MWDYFAGGSDEDAVVRVDDAALDAAVAKVRRPGRRTRHSRVR